MKKEGGAAAAAAAASEVHAKGAPARMQSEADDTRARLHESAEGHASLMRAEAEMWIARNPDVVVIMEDT